MQRFQTLTTETAPTESRPLLEAVQQKFGKVPNLLGSLANSPAGLQAFLSISGALESSGLSPAFLEQVAITVAQENQCQYCLSAHTAIAKMQGVSDADILKARTGNASDPKEAAGLAFALKVVQSRGRVSDEDVEAVRSAGYSDSEIGAIGTAVVKDIFTNYMNHVMGTPIDWPVVDLEIPVTA